MDLAVWDGSKLEFKPAKRVMDGLWEAMLEAMNGGYLDIVPKSYIRTSKMLTELDQAGIATIVDEDGLLKALPITFRSVEFHLVGNIVFVGMDHESKEFKPLTEVQRNILKSMEQKLKS